MFCPACGANIPDNSSFCVNCGSATVPPAAPQPEYQQTQYNVPPQYQPPAYQQPPVYGQPVYQQQTYYNQPPVGGYRAPINKRSIATCIILTIVTCGIYGIIWMINLVDDLNTATQSKDESSGITVFLLSLITCGIYSYVWLYKAGEKVNVIKRFNGEATDTSTSIIYLVLALFGLSLVSYYLIQDQLNRVAAY